GHARGERAIARFLGRERQGAHERRDAIPFAQLDGHDARIALRHRAADFVRDIARIEILFVDDLRRRVDLRERAEEAELLAVVLVLPLPAILAADADVHLAHRHVPAWIALPFSHELG